MTTPILIYTALFIIVFVYARVRDDNRLTQVEHDARKLIEAEGGTVHNVKRRRSVVRNEAYLLEVTYTDLLGAMQHRQVLGLRRMKSDLFWRELPSS